MAEPPGPDEVRDLADQIAMSDLSNMALPDGSTYTLPDDALLGPGDDGERGAGGVVEPDVDRAQVRVRRPPDEDDLGRPGVAALMEGRRFVGIEQSAEYCRMAHKRLAEARREGGINDNAVVELDQHELAVCAA